MSFELRFLTIEQVAEMLQVTKATIYNLQKKGLPFIKLGRNVRYDQEDVINWVKSNQKSHTEKENLKSKYNTI